LIDCFSGVYLQDCLFTDEGNSDFVTEKEQQLINFEKSYLMSGIVQQYTQFQNVPYKIAENTPVLNYLRHLPSIDEKEAHQKSLAIEPRAAPK
jgi:hypothetical protein